MLRHDITFFNEIMTIIIYNFLRLLLLLPTNKFLLQEKSSRFLKLKIRFDLLFKVKLVIMLNIGQ